MLRTYFVLLTALGFLAGCDESHTVDAGSTMDAGPTGSDAGARDAGPSPDSGTSTDAGETADSGAAIDAGAAIDGGDGPDAGDHGPDAGPLPDGGPRECMDPPIGTGRPTAPTCTACRPPGITTDPGSGSGECATDDDCTDGNNGRCQWGRVGRYCNYDECLADADCDDDELCACDVGPGHQNLCITAGCHTDAECGAYECSSSLGTCGNYVPPIGYFCHGPADDCFSDADCEDAPGGFGPADCRYDPERGKWACDGTHCVG